jgi:hypothetical protein
MLRVRIGGKSGGENKRRRDAKSFGGHDFDLSPDSV